MKTLPAPPFSSGKLRLLELAFFSLLFISSYAQTTDKEEYLIARTVDYGN